MLTPGSVLLIFTPLETHMTSRLLSEPAFTPITPGPAPIWHPAPTWADLRSERHGSRPRHTLLPRRPTYKASAVGVGRGSARRASTTTTNTSSLKVVVLVVVWWWSVVVVVCLKSPLTTYCCCKLHHLYNTVSCC